MIRLLLPGEEAAVETFLARHADTSMLLRSNLQKSGLLADRGEPLQATWAGAFEGGQLIGVAAHTWLSTVVLQAPAGAAELARAAARACGRRLKGLIGPWAQVVAARDGLGLANAPATLDEGEVLFTLPLAELRLPTALASGQVTCQPSTESELPLLVQWRMAYCLETGLEQDGPALEETCRRSVELAHRQGSLFTLRAAGQPVASTAFNARLSELVQIGGVWTPVELRGRGYARCAVAGQLLHARERGATRAVLFTGKNQHAAQAAYRALGFVESGDYGLIFFRDPPAL